MFRKSRVRNLIPRIKIIGDGLTEYYYFKHLKELKYKRANIELKRSDFGSKDIMTKIRKIRSDLKGVYSIIIIVFDIENDENKKKIFEERIKLLKNIEVLGLYSNPSIEYWFLLHYTDENRSFNAEELKKYLKTYISGYETSEDFLKNENWVNSLLVNLLDAIQRAKKYKNSEQSYTNMYKGIERLDKLYKKER
jgi:hypothetical protein